MHKQFKSVSLMTLLMALPSGAMMAANVPSEVATVQQQKSTVAKGTVKDANGEPLIGAFVIVKGTTNGAAVDTEGNFTKPVKLIIDFGMRLSSICENSISLIQLVSIFTQN